MLVVGELLAIFLGVFAIELGGGKRPWVLTRMWLDLERKSHSGARNGNFLEKKRGFVDGILKFFT